ncbi:MAG: FAD-dependent oxidoreductase, partial [Desulfarculaceae bacterium]
AMTTLEIEAMVDCFARAAERVLAAGFDGVEIHGAHEYLVHQFMTPYCNQRSDAYGDGLSGRCRFACEVVKAVREAMGPEALLIFRLSGDDHVRGGLTPSDGAEAAGLLASCGVDMFSVTGGVYETPQTVVPPLPSPPGTHIETAAIVGGSLQVPVAGVGRINSAEAAEQALAKVDMVACGRAFLADPAWLEKARQGRQAYTRPCIGCNQGCIDRILFGLPVTCIANPWLGHEGEKSALKAADAGAKVVVVGAGLAGLEAAQTLGRLGHEVVLFESGPRIGGQVLMAAVPPGKEEMLRLVEYYEASLKELPQVEVRLNTEATVAKVCKLKPEAVVVASGSEPVLPVLPGAAEAPVVTARQVLAGQAEVGPRAVVLGGGNLGSEVAHYLAVKGHEVSIIELGLNIGSDLGPARRYLLRRELGEYKIRRHVRSMVRRLYSDRVSFLHIAPDGSRRSTDVGPVDTFVAALGSKPCEALYLALEPKVQAIFLIGDALSPARMGEATSEGARTAVEIHHLHQKGELKGQSRAAC